ncbi:hypothetical protein BGX27_001037 [Mortierella sp. AM989]|nr:hypothetical protein BGX27_001037 [Mortierella sp. AM989]
MVSDKSHKTGPGYDTSASSIAADHDLKMEVSLSAVISSPSSFSPVTDATGSLTLETSNCASLAVVNETRETSVLENGILSDGPSNVNEDCISQDNREELSPTVPETKAMAEPHTSPSSIKSTGVADHEKKEGKSASLLHKIGMRKNSFTESSSAKDTPDSSSTKSHTSNFSARSSFTKGSKRSSMLLGKFVHKILPSSLSHTSSTPTASLQVHTAGLSPVSARSSRSASITSQNNEIMVSAETAATIALPGSAPASSKGSQESLPLYEEEISFASKLAGSPEVNQGNGTNTANMCAFKVEYEDKDIEEEEADDGDEHKNTKDDEAAMSPYVIDDDCDDEFFLNSVLRKKSYPTLNMAPERPPVMSSSYPSDTTLNSMHSSPSLSGWSSASSQASTPSPTSPSFPSNQIYPFPPTNTKAPSMHIHYRSNPLPAPVNSGLDERRARLRDAVCEWRRSANSSSC